MVLKVLMDAQVGLPSESSGHVIPDLCVLHAVTFLTYVVQLQFHASLVCNAVCFFSSGGVQVFDGSRRARVPRRV